MTVEKAPSLVLSGGTGMGRHAHGSALVSSQGFGIRYDMDLERGVIGNPNHDLYGEALTDRVVVFTEPKGGVAASWALAFLSERSIAPAALIFRAASPIFAQGALFGGISILHRLDGDPCTLLRTGDEIAVYPSEGRIEVFRTVKS